MKHIDAIEKNDELGLALRFYYCSNHEITTNEWVLHIDDDMEIDTTAMNELLHYMNLNSKRIVGYYGRSYNAKLFYRHGYDTSLVTGQSVEVLLTKIILLERIICSEFFKYTHLVDTDFIPYSQPKWNGEDIFINLVANHYYANSDDNNSSVWRSNNRQYNNFAIPNLHVWESSLLTFNSTYIDDRMTPNLYEFYQKQLQVEQQHSAQSHTSISGNFERLNIWNVGIQQYMNAMQKSHNHYYYRGKLWYTTKQRLNALKRLGR